jgi:hypothetical protein
MLAQALGQQLTRQRNHPAHTHRAAKRSGILAGLDRQADLGQQQISELRQLRQKVI